MLSGTNHDLDLCCHLASLGHNELIAPIFFISTSLELSLTVNNTTLKHMMGDPQYTQTSNVRGTLGGNKIVDHSDVVGAAPAISSFLT